MKIQRLQRRLGRILFGPMIVVLLAVIVLLLPILLPAAALSEARAVGKLARSKCVSCGMRIGLAEIRRAKQEARAQGSAIMNAKLALGLRPRIVVVWDVTCPTCGHQYAYHPDAVPRLTLVSKDAGPSEQTT